MIEETVRRSPAPSQSPLRSTRRTVDLHPLGSTPSAPICNDTRGREGQEFLGLLHEAGVVTVERRYARGEVIFAEGDPGNALYILTEGAVKLSRDYSEGKEATLMLLGPWEVFGELAFGHRAYQHGRAEVVTDCRVRKVPKVFLERVVKRRPEVALKVVDLLWLELARHREMAGCLLPHKAEAKLASLLPILARKFGDEEDGRIVIRLRLTQEELAKLISSTRESVTHALGELRRRGVLAVANGCMIIWTLLAWQRLVVISLLREARNSRPSRRWRISDEREVPRRAQSLASVHPEIRYCSDRLRFLGTSD